MAYAPLWLLDGGLPAQVLKDPSAFDEQAWEEAIEVSGDMGTVSKYAPINLSTLGEIGVEQLRYAQTDTQNAERIRRQLV